MFKNKVNEVKTLKGNDTINVNDIKNFRFMKKIVNDVVVEEQLYLVTSDGFYVITKKVE